MNTNLNEPQNTDQNNNNNTSQNNDYYQETSNSKVDLSKVDATEETMSLYTYPKEFLKLDLDKIREFIEILEEHYQNLLEQENISLAKSAKQRLILLKNLEKEKMKKEAKIIYSNQRELVQDKMKEELDNYLETTNTEFDSLLQAFENQEVEMLKTQKQELDEFKKNFEKEYEIKKPKPSKQMLNWIKIKNYAVKQNKFEKAEEASKEINKLQRKEMQKFEEEKEKKLNVEMSKIMRRHENEKNGLQMKKNSIIDMFNQTKNKNIEQIQKKFGAKMKELKNYQNFEMANFDKITKGITKPCARIQSIVSSTTGLKEDEKDDENEIKGGEEYDEEDEDGEGNNNENQNQNGENGNGEEQENDNNNENNIEGDQQEQEGENEGNDEQNQEEMNDQEEMNEQEHYEQGNEYEEQDENANEEYEEGNMDNEQYQE
jgi:hypothetical protein